MSDKGITTTSSPKQDRDENLIIEDLKEPLIFVDDEKSKNKSNLKKDKYHPSKHAVKIIVPESDNQNLNDVMKERRKKRPKFKTVKEPQELKDKKLFDMNLKKDVIQELQDENDDNKNDIKNKISKPKFIRKGKRSTTLMEKSRLAEKLLSEEMKVEVRQENLVIQEKGNPKKKYKPIKLLGTGSFGSVYEAENIIFQNSVAMKIINIRFNIFFFKITKKTSSSEFFKPRMIQSLFSR